MVSSSIGASEDIIFIHNYQNSPILSLPNIGITNSVMIDMFENGTINLTNITEIYNNKTKQMFGDKYVTSWSDIRTY